MYCPQCGTESGSGLQYCRLCGANLKVIGKALTLSEAIARSDRGPLPKLKEMVKSLKLEQVTEEVSSALERMNKEILLTSPSGKLATPWSPHSWRRKKTPEERRENHIVKGTISLFSGVGLMIFLYYLAAALVLKVPPHVLAEIPFELDPVVRVLWLVGLIPALSGAGRIFAGLLIRPARSVGSERTLPEQIDTTAHQKTGRCFLSSERAWECYGPHHTFAGAPRVEPLSWHLVSVSSPALTVISLLKIAETVSTMYPLAVECSTSTPSDSNNSTTRIMEKN